MQLCLVNHLLAFPSTKRSLHFLQGSHCSRAMPSWWHHQEDPSGAQAGHIVLACYKAHIKKVKPLVALQFPHPELSAYLDCNSMGYIMNVPSLFKCRKAELMMPAACRWKIGFCNITQTGKRPDRLTPTHAGCTTHGKSQSTQQS